MLTIAIRLATILNHLRQAIAAYAVQQNRVQTVVWLGATAYAPLIPPNEPTPLPDETWALATTRLGRMAARFAALFAGWKSGTLPAPRPSRAGRPYIAKPIPRLPAQRGWINARVPAAAPCAGMTEALLHDPELPPFLAAAPQAGRILRPLCRMLGLTPPACLRLPPRPKPPARPAAPKPEPPQGTPFRPLQPEIRAAARAWKKYDR